MDSDFYLISIERRFLSPTCFRAGRSGARVRLVDNWRLIILIRVIFVNSHLRKSLHSSKCGVSSKVITNRCCPEEKLGSVLRNKVATVGIMDLGTQPVP